MSNLPLSEQLTHEEVTQLTSTQVQENLKLLDSNWANIDDIKINRTFELPDFKQAIGFVNKIADLAEEVQHHPDIHIYYTQVVVESWTHSVGGLSQNDFILAAKIDLLFDSMQP